MKDIYNENYKTLQKEIKEELIMESCIVNFLVEESFVQAGWKLYENAMQLD